MIYDINGDLDSIYKKCESILRLKQFMSSEDIEAIIRIQNIVNVRIMQNRVKQKIAKKPIDD